MLLITIVLALQTPIDSVQIVTRDIPNFWRAYDQAAGKDSAERVRIFERVYFQPGSPGLRDWIRVRLMNPDTVRARLARAGWPKARLDSLPRDSVKKVTAPFYERSAAEQLLQALAQYPRYYSAVRATTLAVDTNSRITQGVRRGLTRLAVLYPEARFPNVYFLIGTLSTGGTTAQSGMLIGTEQSASDPATPLDELPDWARKNFPTHTFESLVGLVVHEAVHTQQKPAPEGQHDTLLRHALGEGIADFLAELAVGSWAANAPRQVYGRAHEHDVWVDFQDEMEIAGDSIIRMWMYNGMVPPEKNHGAIDIGYWVGYRIAGAYYARAKDKRAAVRELLELRDAEAILRASGYAP
ncbi:MAG: hypothetical protein DMD38_01370 [Gemmatimonadetes bacterium]|nr:MAG: hypothetical protein AUI86_06220 [Gemmatimonadetes bacterium 13_1_40CM_3_66_12]OLD89390.1 MAG: hypothetical protein AUG85_01950 [Gemmatimonadetes bacterium 13_1_20CM_4_66_11]PYP98069.1 MAG: hypothetical protein DMD38_01370 [Gemmatimonadota bacterium]